MMRKTALPILLSLTMHVYVHAQTKAEVAVDSALEQLRKAMVDGDSAMLMSLTLPALSYGHSGGHVDDQAEFVQKIVSGKSDFVAIDISDQHLTLSRDVAVVRHKFHATTNDSGTPGTVDLSVLLIWQKQKKSWKLLARQAVKAK